TSQQDTVLRIANKKTSSHILTREIRTHIEFPRIARRRNRFGDAEQFQFIAEFGAAAPAHKQRRVGRPSRSFELNRLEFEQKRRESVRRHLWLRGHEPDGVHNAWSFAEISCEMEARCIAGSKIVE